MGVLFEANVRTVFVRDSLGRFAAECDAAAVRAADRIAKVGETTAKGNVPIRTGALRNSIKGKAQGNRAVVECGTAHWRFQEFGTSSHLLIGSVFFSQRDGKIVTWKAGPQGGVIHPGNRARPFMKPAYTAMVSVSMKIAREEFPG